MKKLPILVLLIAVGIAVTAATHPYSSLLFNTRRAVESHVDNENPAPLLSAIRCSYLPHKVRAGALAGLIRIRDQYATPVYLDNDEIERLMTEFPKEDYLYEILYRPFLGDQINPRLASISSDIETTPFERFVAFMQIIEPTELSVDQAEQIYTLWESLADTALKEKVKEIVYHLHQCDGDISTNVVNSFLKREG